MFEAAAKLEQYAEREKRLAHDTERAYWQGTCDACRKLTNVFRGAGMYSELFEDALAESEEASRE
jgi:hypothetical protein